VSLHIDPDTKVGALLEAYPDLEPVLIGLAPAFERLRNPILRKTVAKVATLEQAAKIGGVGLKELIARLREAAGQKDEPFQVLNGAAAGSTAAGSEWLATAPVMLEIDADAMLAKGVHPVAKVKESVATLEPGTAVRLTAGFRPEPLIELMRRSGAEVYSAEIAPGRHATWFGRR
jgi:hypothetical protein